MIPCAYCNTLCQPTREHIVPRWYCLTPGDTETFNAREPVTHLKGDLMIKDVCSNCNGGVLSHLDAYGKELYDRYFALTVELGDAVVFDFDFERLSRWLLKLCFNSGRANGTDLSILTQYRDGILGRQLIGASFYLSCHLIGPSIVDTQRGFVRPATPADSEEDKMPAHWFRICHMRLQISPTTQVVQRQILINSYAFSMIVASPVPEPTPEFENTIAAFKKTYPSSVQLRPEADHARIICNWDHAAQSIDQLYSAFPNRFGRESNEYTKKLLRQKDGGTILTLTRDMIHDGDVQSASDALKSMIRNQEMALAHRMRVGLLVDGYNDNPRELWEVPEAREYIRRLFIECPFVMLLAHPELCMLKLLFACWIFEPEDNTTDAMNGRQQDFLHRCFAGNNDVTYRLCISPEIQKQIERSAIRTIFPDFPISQLDSS